MRKPLRGRRSGPLWVLSLIVLYTGYTLVVVYFQGSFKWLDPLLFSIISLIVIIAISSLSSLMRTRAKTQSNLNSSETELLKTEPKPTLKLNPTWTYAQQQIIDLPIRRDMDRLASFILNPGGSKFLLTGYESFGGTSLVRGAIKKAQNELYGRHFTAENLCVFYFEIVENIQGRDRFDIVVNGVRFGQLHSKEGSLFEQLENVIPEINLTRPLHVSLLSKFTQKLTKEERADTLNFNLLVSGLSQLFEDNFKKSRLQEELRQRLGKSMEPVYAVIILDRINHLETLKTLNQFELFNNSHISVIAVAHKECFDEWQNAESQLKIMGFDPLYIPCLWHGEKDYIDQITKTMFDVYNASSINPTLLKKHFEFVGHGVLGNLLIELRKNLLSTDARGRVMEVLRPRSDIEHNAWRQVVLDRNWSLILGGWFAGSQQIDRGRIGVYHLLQKIDEKAIFTLPELLDEAIHYTPVSIHSNPTIITDVTWNLLEVLRQNQYIVKKENVYRRTWQEGNPPEIISVEKIEPVPSSILKKRTMPAPLYLAEISMEPGQPQAGQSMILRVTVNRSVDMLSNNKNLHAYVSSESLDVKQDAHIKLITLTNAGSESVEFTLVPQSPGEKQISVDLFQNTHYLGGRTLATSVTELPQISPIEAKIHTDLGLSYDRVQVGPDITIIVSNQQLNNGSHYYQYVVLARNQSQSVQNEFTTEQTHPNPEAIYKIIFDHLNTPNMAENKLHNIGVDQYNKLIPMPLQELIQNELYVQRDANIFPNVQLIAKDAWVPWELMRLKNPETGKESEFLCERCNLTRYLRGVSFPIKIKVKRIGLIVDDKSLAYSRLEADNIKRLFADKVEVDEIAFSENEIMKAFEKGGYSILHFICHGQYNSNNPDYSTISLQDDKQIHPYDINGNRTQCRKDKPFVFMNVCETGQSAKALTGMGGWAEAFIRRADSCGFVGSIWQVQDRAASIFAVSFYQNLLDGKTVGESVRLARQAIKKPGDSSWLSYTVYADPMAKLYLD